MAARVRLRSIALAWDLIGAATVTVALIVVLPSEISLQIAKEIFSVGVSVLAIIFSVFFAAIAIVITAGDNEFVKFLEKDGHYTSIIWTFRSTLVLLFVALLAAIALLIITLPYQAIEQYPYPAWYFPEAVMLGFGFLALYALFTAASASLDAIKYAQFRARYIELMRSQSDD
jgi:hypothetical protein